MTPLTPAERETVMRWLKQIQWPRAAMRSEKEVHDAEIAALILRYFEEGRR